MSIKSLHDCQLTRYSLPMALPADYHMHTPLCRHAKGEPVEYAARALELGLPEIGFSDHSPVEHDDQDDWRMLAGELAQYVTKVEHAREIHPAMPIRLGLEVDFIPGYVAIGRNRCCKGANCSPAQNPALWNEGTCAIIS